MYLHFATCSAQIGTSRYEVVMTYRHEKPGHIVQSFSSQSSWANYGVSASNSWRRCPTYGRDVVSYCYLCLCNLCRPPYLPSSSVLCNIFSAVTVVLSQGSSKGMAFVFVLKWSVAISCHNIGSHITSSLIKHWFFNDYTIWIIIIGRKS